MRYCDIRVLSSRRGSKRTFVLALRAVRALCADDDDGHGDDVPQMFPDLQNSPRYSDTMGCRTRSFCFSVEATTPLLREVLDLDGANHMYSRAFLLANDIPATTQEATAILLFNIGLAHHLEGVRHGKSADVRLAIAFYKQSFSLVDDMREQLEVELLVLMGALCHNMAHCFRNFRQQNFVEAMVEELAHIVQWIEASQQPICSRDDEFFQTSLYFATVINDFRFAPAA